MTNLKILIICRPFNFKDISLPPNFYFAFLEAPTVRLVEFFKEQFHHIFIEESIAKQCMELTFNYAIVKDFVLRPPSPKTPHLLLTPCNDTHCNLFKSFQDKYSTLYAIPHPDNKNENALKALIEQNIEPVVVRYNQEASNEIIHFAPTVALCGNDWCTEFRTIKGILKNQNCIYAALQEGPQDWGTPINGNNPNKYLNSDVLLAQGPSTLKYIQPKFFSITGTPKTDTIGVLNLPKKPKVLINCNFTYGNWEEDRDLWIHSAIDACKKSDLDYFISQHPRDKGSIDDKNVIKSSAYSIREQMAQCSITISRFSLIPLESLSSGRHSIYFNPHGETPVTFNDDPTPGIFKCFDNESLHNELMRHKSSYSFNYEEALQTLEYHCGLIDGNSSERITKVIWGLSNNRLDPNFLKNTFLWLGQNKT